MCSEIVLALDMLIPLLVIGTFLAVAAIAISPFSCWVNVLDMDMDDWMGIGFYCVVFSTIILVLFTAFVWVGVNSPDCIDAIKASPYFQ